MKSGQELETYLSLSTELYDLDKVKVPEDEFAFYIDYARECQSPILEPMCGSGRFLLRLIEEGFRVDGFDASPFMLKALYKNCEAKRLAMNENFLKSQIWQGFLQDLDSAERYGLVLVPDASFNLILNIEEVKICLGKIYEHLQKKGKFVFELATLKYAEQIKAGTTGQFSKNRSDGKCIVQRMKILPFEGQIARTKCSYELIDRNGKVLKEETEEFSLFLHDPDDVEFWLMQAGFRDIKRLKAFIRAQTAASTDSVIVLECTK